VPHVGTLHEPDVAAGVGTCSPNSTSPHMGTHVDTWQKGRPGPNPFHQPNHPVTVRHTPSMFVAKPSRKSKAHPL
jgi:hypothetical protein